MDVHPCMIVIFQCRECNHAILFVRRFHDVCIVLLFFFLFVAFSLVINNNFNVQAEQTFPLDFDFSPSMTNVCHLTC